MKEIHLDEIKTKQFLQMIGELPTKYGVSLIQFIHAAQADAAKQQPTEAPDNKK